MRTAALKPGFMLRTLLISLLLIALAGQLLDELLRSRIQAMPQDDDHIRFLPVLLLMREWDDAELRQKLPELATVLHTGIELLPADSIHFSKLNQTDDFIPVSDGKYYFLYAALNESHYVQFGPLTEINNSHLFELALSILFYGVIALVFFYWLAPLIRNLDLLSSAADEFLQYNRLKTLNIDQRAPLYPLAQTFNRLVTALNEMLDYQAAMFRTVSHELRTPLSRIKFSLALIERKNLNQSDQNYLHNIADNIGALEQLIEQMLRYSKIEHAREQLRIENIDVRQLLMDLKKTFSSAGTVQLDLDIASLPEKVCLAGDYQLLSIACSNLLQNAQRYAQKKAVLRAVLQHKMLKLYMEDDGPGIPAQELPTLYKAFSGTKTHANGTKTYGLGLAIVRHIMHLHCGEIEYTRSEHLGGACFTLTLPL